MRQLNDASLKKLIDEYGLIEEGDKEAYAEVKATLFSKEIVWQKNAAEDTDAFSFKAEVNSHVWKLRINDFPAEPMYTLFIDNRSVLTFDDLPPTWKI